MIRNGYSLIEVLVVLAILGILFGTGYTTFRDFSRRQALTDAAKEVQADLRTAQEMALAGQKPNDPKCTGTNSLNGYFFEILSSTHYQIVANCTGGSASTPTKDINFTGDISIANPFPNPNPILFRVLGNGTNIGASNATIRVRQASTGTTLTVSVSSGGQIQ